MEAARQESVKEVEERASVALSSAVTRGEREIELVRAEMTQQMAAVRRERPPPIPLPSFHLTPSL